MSARATEVVAAPRWQTGLFRRQCEACLRWFKPSSKSTIGVQVCSGACLLDRLRAASFSEACIAEVGGEVLPAPASGEFRSRAEREFARWLDARGLRWAYERIVLLIGRDWVRRYWPDFAVEIGEGATLVEVKPNGRERLWKVEETPLPVVVVGPTAMRVVRG